MKHLIIAILLVASPALGTVYRWNDSAGIAHYTNREYDIPDRYKSRAKPLYPEATDPRPGSSAGSGEQKSPESVPPPAAAVRQPAPARAARQQTPATAARQQAPPPIVKVQPINAETKAEKRARRERERAQDGEHE